MASVVQILVERVFVIKFPGMAIISYRVAVTTFANNIPFKTWVYGPGGYSSLIEIPKMVDLVGDHGEA